MGVFKDKGGTKMELKTILNVEITSPDSMDVLPEEGQTEEEFKSKEKQKELRDFRKKFAKEYHQCILKFIKDYFKFNFEENFLDDISDYSVESWESLKDYGTKVKVFNTKLVYGGD
jgi:hypothetical protein